MTFFVDANVITGAFTNNANRIKCSELLNQQFVTNTLCLVESREAISLVSQNAAYAARCIKSLFKGSGFIVDLDKNLLFESLKMAGTHNLDAFDLIHYMTALLENCAEIVSYDKDFDNLPIKRTIP
ncbi:PIN domain-containing protein [Candidatus Woesearchaeota archaeon]|nr:PIN domain-containing protein [Candidatus Woesearchaeota archaeon]